MSKKRKSEAIDPHAPSYEGNAHEKSQHCEVKVRGAIEVHPSASSIDLHNSERWEETAQRKLEYGLSKRTHSLAQVSLLFSILYFFVTGLIFWQTKKAADAAHGSVQVA